MIPFLDLQSQHRELEEDLMAVFRNALRNAAFIGGPEVDAFEEEFADFCGTRFCVGVSSGTDALLFALIAAGIGSGEKVITVPNTFFATTEAICQAGATPLFVDVDEQTYNLDPRKLQLFLEKECSYDSGRRITIHRDTGSPITAIIPVHIYGQPAEMDTIINIAQEYNLKVIEDACQAHGAQYYSKEADRWKMAGSMGIAAAFSFYAGKNIGACGEGGAVTTDSEEIATKIRMLRDHGQARKYFHNIEGYNGRLPAIQAGILRVKLKQLREWNGKRRECAHLYNQFLEQVDGVITPHESSWARSVYHLYVIRTKNRDALLDFLSQHNIGVGIHYPIPCHLQEAYTRLGYVRSDFPVAERAASEILSLPMFPGLTEPQIREVNDTIQDFLHRQQIPSHVATSEMTRPSGSYI